MTSTGSGTNRRKRQLHLKLVLPEEFINAELRPFGAETKAGFQLCPQSELGDGEFIGDLPKGLLWGTCGKRSLRNNQNNGKLGVRLGLECRF